MPSNQLRVEHHLRLLGVEDLRHLCAVALRVLQDLLARKGRTRLVLAGGIADHAGEVADQELHLMAQLLELAQLVDHHRMPEMQVGRRRVEAQLHAHGRVALELAHQLALDDQFLTAALDQLKGLRNGRLVVLPHGRFLLD